ncbi:uncharacterized protein [Hetaerina americana]|uniref:uncharacterized protein n=1 Tax=Hetaerina americana TaxID=62018 RepID=UPI003A7F6279
MMQEEKEAPKLKLKIKPLPSRQTQSSEQLHSRRSRLQSQRSFDGNPPLQGRQRVFCSFMKIMELVFAVICAVLYYKGVMVMPAGHRRVMPNVTFYSYMVINIIVIIDLFRTQKISGHVVRLLSLLGAVLFAVAGALSIETWGKKEYDEISPEIQFCGKVLLAVGIISIMNAVLFCIDTIYSYRVWVKALCQ